MVPAETLKACALTGLLLKAAEGEAGSRGSQSPPDLGDMWPFFVRFSRAQRGKPGVGCYRAKLVRRKGVLFLEDWERARVALSYHVALDMLCQEIHEAWWLGCRCREASKESLSLTVDGL